MVILDGRDADEFVHAAERLVEQRPVLDQRPVANGGRLEVIFLRQHQSRAGGLHCLGDARQAETALRIVDRVVGYRHRGCAGQIAQPDDLTDQLGMGCGAKRRRRGESRVDLQQHTIALLDELLDAAQRREGAVDRSHPLRAGDDAHLRPHPGQGKIRQRDEFCHGLRFRTGPVVQPIADNPGGRDGGAGLRCARQKIAAADHLGILRIGHGAASEIFL